MNRQTRNSIDRRQFLKGTGLLGLALVGGGAMSALSACTFATPGTASPAAAPPISAAMASVTPTPDAGDRRRGRRRFGTRPQGDPRPGWHPRRRGDRGLELPGQGAGWRPEEPATLPDSYLGPVFRARKGSRYASTSPTTCRRVDHPLARAARPRRHGRPSALRHRPRGDLRLRVPRGQSRRHVLVSSASARPDRRRRCTAGWPGCSSSPTTRRRRSACLPANTTCRW